MDRRNFLKASALCAGALATGEINHSEGKAGTAQTRLKTIGSVREPRHLTPIVDSADVVVVGGGPAGFAASVAAARQGCSVILLERGYFLGGLFTGCDVTVLNNMYTPTHEGKKQAVFGICQELCRRLEDNGMIAWLRVEPNVDTEAAKYIMERMCIESGVRILYGVQAAQVVRGRGESIDSVIIETKSGRVAVRGKFFVDCTGDGDLLEWTGEDFTEYKYDISAMWRAGNINDAKGHHATPNPGVYTEHLGSGIRGVDGLDMYVLSDAQIQLRKQMWDKVMKMREDPETPSAFLLSSPSVVGVRITRVLNSIFNVTARGAVDGAVYEDTIGFTGADSTLEWDGRKIKRKDRRMWQVPYRSLVPKNVPNLLVAGRCFGFEKELMYDAREVGTCILTGEAAGVAAAQAVAFRCSCRDMDIKRLQATLRSGGSVLEM